MPKNKTKKTRPSQQDNAIAAEFTAKLGPIPSDPSDLHEALLRSVPGLKPKFPPLERVPCANAHIVKDTVCGKPGTKSCGACRLVSYCSQECQKEHWTFHKRNCKDYLRSDDFKPAWVQLNREPMFVNPHYNTLVGSSSDRPNLWGTTPAIDVLNDQDLDCAQDISIAFPSSGDLRHVLKTINGLPSNYTGKLTILLNDPNPVVSYRNIVLLLLLATTEDPILAADIALHFWYSIFMPIEYHFHVTLALTTYLAHMNDEGLDAPFALGPTSKLYSLCPSEAAHWYAHCSTADFDPDDAQDEYDKVMRDPLRLDWRDRLYAKLKPSHRVAFQEWRDFGVLLPFGAVHSHFNHPNSSLFTAEGEWIQGDGANPLDGWDIPEVIEEGKNHGTSPEDIYGCLYFYLTSQLRTLSTRLRTFNTQFHVFPLEPTRLGKSLLANDNFGLDIPNIFEFPPFYRIFMGDAMDVGNVGLELMLDSWAGLLKKETRNENDIEAVLLGYFSNWVYEQKGARVRDDSGQVMDQAMDRYLAFTDPTENKYASGGLQGAANKLQADMWSMINEMDAFHDNSHSFSMFLKKQNLEKIMHRTKLALKEKHKVVPHRFGVPLNASPDAMPEFPNQATWYQYAKVSGITWTERFVEFGWAEDNNE